MPFHNQTCVLSEGGVKGIQNQSMKKVMKVEEAREIDKDYDV